MKVVPRYFSEKSYEQMNRHERRAYKVWLWKNSMWDGAIVMENIDRMMKRAEKEEERNESRYSN